MLLGTLNPLRVPSAKINGPKLVTKSDIRASRAAAEHKKRETEYLARQIDVVYPITPEAVEYWTLDPDTFVCALNGNNFSIWDARRAAVKAGKRRLVIRP